MSVELLLDAHASVGEGSIWDARHQRLFWVDITAGHLHLFDPTANSHRRFTLGQMVGTVVPRAQGGVMLGLHHGFATFDLDTEQLTFWSDPEADQPRNRFNDGKCDPAGRFWAGTLSLDRVEGAGSLYRLDPDGRVRTMLRGVSNSNGIVWSLDKRTLYYIDTPTLKVSAFDYDLAAGEITNRRTIITVPAEWGKPDGMTIDAEGMLWVALWGGWRVTRWDPNSGSLLSEIPVPAAQTSSCAFGGPNLDELYITTARIRISDDDLVKQPHAGGLFRARAGVQGVPAFEFAG